MLVWLERAIHDRDAQLDYIAQDNPLAAVSQGDHIDEQVDILLQQPQMGRSGRKQATRELAISRTPFIVVYRINGKRSELLRLLHGAQKWPKGG